MDADAFVWVADEDAELLGILMSRWHRVSAALVEAANRGAVVMSPAAAAFSQALVQAILVALAARHEEDLSQVAAAALAQDWPNRATSGRSTTDAP